MPKARDFQTIDVNSGKVRTFKVIDVPGVGPVALTPSQIRKLRKAVRRAA